MLVYYPSAGVRYKSSRNLPPNSDRGSPFRALFHELTLPDLISPPWRLEGEIKLAPLADKTSHLSLDVDSLRSFVTSFNRDGLDGVGHGEDASSMSRPVRF